MAVHVGGTSLAGELSTLAGRKDNPAIAHAAYLSLDRLTLQQPAEMLDVLQRQPDLLNGREATRANLFARASVQDAKQRETLERYLLAPERGSTEVGVFAGIFPNANYMLSNNLLTQNTPPGRAVLEQRDREALHVIEEWIADPRFASQRPQLEKIHRRLTDYLNSSSK